MKTLCPQCGKELDVSLEELSLRDGLVVCPQCLTSYQAVEPGTLTPPATKNGGAKTVPTMRYCPHCGESIGEGINFCPYCGGNLHANTLDAANPTKAVDSPASHSRHGSHDKGTSHHQHGNDKEKEQQLFDWKPIIPSYRLAQIRRQEPASMRFQAFAISVILALLALLAFIIYKASLLP